MYEPEALLNNSMKEPRFENMAEHKESSLAEELTDAILPLLGVEATFDEYEGTYEIDSNILQLTFTVEDGLLEIRNIESGQRGLGKQVLSRIHMFADKHHMSVIASTVKDTAHSFWEEMGYSESSDPGEFVRR
jgi:hypothetical protein